MQVGGSVGHSTHGLGVHSALPHSLQEFGVNLHSKLSSHLMASQETAGQSRQTGKGRQ